MKRVTKETRELQKAQQILHAKAGPTHGVKQEGPTAHIVKASDSEKSIPTSLIITNTNINERANVSTDSTTMGVEAIDDQHSKSIGESMDSSSSSSSIVKSDTIAKSLTVLTTEASSSSSSSQQHVPNNKTNNISISNSYTTKSATQLEVENCHNILLKSEAEREALFRSISLETQLHREVVRWMQAMQELLWPTTDEQVYLGRPLSPSSSSSTNRITVDDDMMISLVTYTKTIMKQLQLLTPLGLIHMEKAASIVGIYAIEDVKYILDIFKWLSWINLTLHLLRLPPTTLALKRIIDSVQRLRFVDENIIKLLESILQRDM